jgi:transcriptional regulator with XRE-family HTH domain
LRKVRGGASQADFADRIGVGRVALANYEAGRRTPSSKVLESYSRVSGVSVPWILTGLDAGDSTAFDRRFEELVKKLAAYRDAGVFPKAVVSDDEFALLKVLRGLRIDQAIEVVRSVLAFYDATPIHQNGYVTRQAARLRKLVAADRPPEAGVDFDALLEGFGMLKRGRRRKTVS